jgi:hypothetical protein
VQVPEDIKRRIERLQTTMPKQPLRDGPVAGVGRERAEIAALFLDAGDVQSASDWYLEAARFTFACGNALGALPLVKRALQLTPNRADGARALYATLWSVLFPGSTPEPVR